MSDLVSVHLAGDYSEQPAVVHARNTVAVPSPAEKHSSLVKGETAAFGSWLKGLDAYSRHKAFINQYVVGKEGSVKPSLSKPAVASEHAAVRREHRFVRSEEEMVPRTWEQELAIKYYNRLYREYCLADFSRHAENKIGLRWRTEREVFSGKGQFVCGALGCDAREELDSYEVAFSYREAGETKTTLVKLRVCPSCASLLTSNFEKKHRKRKRQEEPEEPLPSEEREQGAEEQGSCDTKEAAAPMANCDSGKGTWKRKAVDLQATQSDDFDQYLNDLLM